MALFIRHLDGEDATSQSYVCSLDKRNELHKHPHPVLERTGPTPPRNNLSSLEIAPQCRL